MPIARHVFQTGALLCAVVSIVACSRTDDAEVVTQAVIAEEVDVAAPAAETIAETESVSSILESIAAARDDIARGDAIDAESALGIALDLLATFATETNAPCRNWPCWPCQTAGWATRKFAPWWPTASSATYSPTWNTV